MAYPYPSEQPGEFWVTYTRQVAALYERAGQPFPDAGGEAFRWFSRPAYDIGAGMEPEAARVKHLRGLEEGLGLVPPPPPRRLSSASIVAADGCGVRTARGFSGKA